ncbi:ABC transporter ATP-binding protein [Streptomyces sp. BE147]|uniref:ABC transporter ATP-binding protein n=1 Tax=unclassified Streptomyces TaxID=2593676 RepID=UPI002E79F664|nr:ABC transporter ATP-binding protein [Streptomyces sp. BE147]MEE1739380.1 ABC transporter ATP-binding protein [Streptomyces sp. BE147]
MTSSGPTTAPGRAARPREGTGLTAENISVTLGGAQVVRELSMHVPAGRFVGVVGPNGCGKSTFLKSVYKVVTPDSGGVTLGGLDVLASRPRTVFTRLAVVAQFNELSFDFTVAEIVAMGRVPHKRLLETTGERDRETVRLSLDRVRMGAYADRSFRTLSGGEKQRVMLARALAQEPSFLILDEPTNHLDIKYQLQIFSIVKELGIGVLAALHDLSMAAGYCDELYVLKDGAVVTHGPPDRVLTRELIREVYEVECETYRNPVTGRLAIAYLDAYNRPLDDRSQSGREGVPQVRR